jgi:tetratricopeptide (TPR) repeat protein
MRREWLWSISTVILLESWALVIASFLLLIPWNLLQQAINNHNLSTIDYISLLIGTGSIIWAILIFLFVRSQKSKEICHQLEDSILIDLANFDNLQLCIERLREFGVYHLTEYRFIGNNLTSFLDYQDNTEEKIEEAPITLKNLRNRSNRPYVVLIPKRFWARFKNEPEALSSVLVHEAAHLKNKDLDLFIVARDFILVAFSINLICFIVSLSASIYVDSSSFEFITIQASLIGKIYQIFQIVPIILLYFTQKKLELWREALADREAVRICGERALNKAEELLRNLDLIRNRPFRNQARNSLILSPYWVLLSGFVGTIISSRFGVLYYLQRDIVTNIYFQNILILLSTSLLTIFLYTICFYILAVMSRNAIETKRSWLRVIGINSLLFILASSSSYFLLEIIPLFITSSFMPTGFDYIKRVDTNFSSLTHSIISSFITGSNIVILAIFGAWIAGVSRKLWLGLVPGICWVITSQLESKIFPFVMEGKLAILSTISLIAILIVRYRRHIYFGKISLKNSLFFVPLIVLLILGRMGYGDVGHRAASYSQAGLLKLKADETTEAVDYFQKATEYAPRHPQAWIDLAITLAKDDKLKEAAEAADKAIVAPFNYSWDEKLKSLVVAGNFRFQLRTSEDLEIAEKYYKEVEKMWRQNSRLSSEYISSALYNLACLYAIRDRNTLESTIYLAEASAINSQIANSAINNTDLSILDLRNQQPLSQQEINKLRELKVNMEVPILRKFVNQRQLSTETLLRFVKLLAQSK